MKCFVANSHGELRSIVLDLFNKVQNSGILQMIILKFRLASELSTKPSDAFTKASRIASKNCLEAVATASERSKLCSMS